MKKTICDRCGQEILDTYVWDPETIYTHFDIKAKRYARVQHPFFTDREKIIDLCTTCEKEFSEWLSNKED